MNMKTETSLLVEFGTPPRLGYTQLMLIAAYQPLASPFLTADQSFGEAPRGWFPSFATSSRWSSWPVEQ